VIALPILPPPRRMSLTIAASLKMQAFPGF
jgi:hypothetical protein